ncbi:MAG TPA: 50S ribosomal protein L22 [Tepidisphaeraceae bacterium]|jgi:large subunit ribosomal protein L22|nr:50S ribosomal protein L22 [Tepidisphaeraceae bacterium]
MAFTAKHRFARIAPRKARLVMDLIRGRAVDDALALLSFSKKRAAVLIDKVVRSAVANASEQEADTTGLFVKQCWADPGPIIKRFQPKDRGKAYAIQKKMSHLVVTLDERGEK